MPQLVALREDELPHPRGTLVRDTRTGQLGHFMGITVTLTREGQIVRRIAYLRPQGGGTEWETYPEALKLPEDDHGQDPGRDRP